MAYSCSVRKIRKQPYYVYNKKKEMQTHINIVVLNELSKPRSDSDNVLYSVLNIKKHMKHLRMYIVKCACYACVSATKEYVSLFLQFRN